MKIRPIVPSDRDLLATIWERSVRATHTFLSEEDIQFFRPLVRDYLHSDEPEFLVLTTDASEVIGFMGLSPNKIDALFIAPEYFRHGGGRLLVNLVLARGGEWKVDVNEQNPGACRFYERCGFVREGRSALDPSGRPFPILHMRYAGSEIVPENGSAN